MTDKYRATSQYSGSTFICYDNQLKIKGTAKFFNLNNHFSIFCVSKLRKVSVDLCRCGPRR